MTYINLINIVHKDKKKKFFNPTHHDRYALELVSQGMPTRKVQGCCCDVLSNNIDYRNRKTTRAKRHTNANHTKRLKLKHDSK